MVVGQQPVPADLQAIVDELARSDQEAKALVQGLTDPQLNWQPHSDAWSIAQCLDHLARMNSVYTAALSQAIRRKDSAAAPRQGEIRPGWPSRLFIQSMDAPPSRKFSTPKQCEPTPHLDGIEVLKAFVDAHDKVRDVIQESENLDLNRIRFKNPFVPLLRWTVGTGLLIMAAHDRRHLWQAKQVRRSLADQRL